MKEVKDTKLSVAEGGLQFIFSMSSSYPCSLEKLFGQNWRLKSARFTIRSPRSSEDAEDLTKTSDELGSITRRLVAKVFLVLPSAKLFLFAKGPPSHFPN